MTTAPPVTIKPRRNWKRIAYRILRIPIFIYLLVIILLALLQTKLIFIGASTQGTPAAAINPPPGSELLKLTTPDGTPIAALFTKPLDPSTPSASAPTVLFFYGNAMCLADAIGEMNMFRDCGANVLCVDYEGYGMSGGKPSEQGCYAAAEAAYQHLIQRTDIDTRKLVPAGWSLGAAVAIDLAHRHAAENHIAGLITLSAFTSMVDVARVHYPFAPVSLILRHRFLSEEKIATLHIPFLLIHGRQDNVAPFEMADRLAAAATKGGCPVTRLTFDNAGHTDIFAPEGEVDDAIVKFLKSLPTK